MIALVTLLFAMQVPAELKQHVEAGLAAKRMGDWDAAIREFRRVVELAPRLPAAYVNLGAVYYEKKDYGGAIPPLRQALELNPDLPGAHAMLGAALLAQGYSSEAVDHLEKGKADDLLGVALLESGRPREAIDKLEGVLEQQPGNSDLLYYLSQAHERLARLAAERLLERSPDSPRAHQLLGESRAAAGNHDGAEKELRAALTARPELRGVHLLLGDLYLASGDYDQAEREFRTEATLAPGSAAAAGKLGLVLLNRGETRAAITELERGNRLQPDNAEILLQLGKARYNTGESAAAEKIFLRVLELEKGSGLAATAHFQLADLYRKAGRTADADREMRAFQDIRKERGAVPPN